MAAAETRGEQLKKDNAQEQWQNSKSLIMEGSTSVESSTTEGEECEEIKLPTSPPYYCSICNVYCASAINLKTHLLGLKHKRAISMEVPTSVESSTTEGDESLKYMVYNPASYYCNICKIYCASAINLQTHFLGLKHKAVEEALKAHGIVKPLRGSGEPVKLPENLPEYILTEPEKNLGRTLEEQLNSCKDTEPAIGLQYIIEYRSKDSLIYECNLCICQAGLTNMLMHVLGIKHRMAYLKKHHPEIGEVKGRGSKLNQKLRELAAKVEQEEGRKPIRSTMDLPIPKDDLYSVQFSDSLVTWFAEDDTGEGKKKEDSKSAGKETDKKAEEASQAKGDNKSEDKKESEQSTAQQQNALFLDSDSDSEDFTNNEGLLKYLKSFEIVDEDDAAFILKVTQKLTDALVFYREKASERKNVYEQNPYGNFGDHSEQRTSVGAARDHAGYGFSQWKPPAERSFEEKGTNSSVKIPAKRKASELPFNPSTDKVKTRKPGAFVPTFKALPNDPDFREAKGPAEPQGPRATFRGNRHPDAGRGPHAPSRDRRGQGAAPKRNAASRNPEGRGRGPPSLRGRGRGPPSLQNRSRVPPPVPSQSEGNVIGRFFNSVRNMDVDEVTDTLQKIATSNPAFSAPVGQRKAVWIIGHDVIYWAGDYAASSGWGTALGLKDRLQITWMGQRGMHWDALLPTVARQVSRLGSPDAIIIQLGENDIPEQKKIDFIMTMSADLHTVMSRLPNTRFFWSELLERREWPGAASSGNIDMVRRNISATAGQLVEAAGGFVIRHPDITFKQTPLFKADGINLSEWGLDIWLHGIRHGLLCWLES